MRRSTACLLAVFVAVMVGTGAAGAASSTWNVAKVGGPAGGDGVVIAVVDTGVDADHPAFGNRVLPQINVVGRDGDGNGHGTHVAGTAAGGSINCGNGPMAIGVAPEARILPVRVLGEDGAGSVESVAAGIRAAADAGADVINLSLGPEIALGDLTGADTTLESAIAAAWSKGSIPVLAAGNGSLLGALLGSGYGDIRAVVVTATTRNDTKPGYATSVGSANWGVAAPGGSGAGELGDDVLSAWKDDQCALLSGTSMAAPHVAGALAVLRSRGLSPQQAVDRVLSTARSIGGRATFGAGLVDLAAATDGLPASTTTSRPSTTAPTTTAAASTTRSPATGPSTTAPSTTEPPQTTGPSTSRAPTTTSAPAPAEVAADLRVDVEDDTGSIGTPLTVVAGTACAAVWLLLGRAALRLRG